MENLLEKFNQMKATPTELLSEVTDKETGEMTENISSITQHTAPEEKTFYSTPGGHTEGNKLQDGQNLNLGNLINADLQIKLLNSIMPVVIVILIKRFTDKKATKDQFELSKDEQNTMAPVLDACLRSINFNVDNPWTALIITAGCIYGTKTIEFINDMPAKRERKYTELKSVDLIEGKRKNRPSGMTYNKKKKDEDKAKG